MTFESDIDTTTQIRAPARPTNLKAGMEELARFAKDASHMDEALDRLSELSGPGAERAVARLKEQLAAFEPCITLLGQVKSGKTSLINAMAGWADLLPSDVNPWTSVVTSLHLTPASRRAETGARFRFMTEAEWDRLTTKGGRIGELAGRAGAAGELEKIRRQIETIRETAARRLGRNFELLIGQEHDYGYFDKNLLERYICLGDDFDSEDDGQTGDDQGRFADITRSAELFLNCQTVPFRMCLRDTPGVNDTFMMREMVTINAVRDSKLCVVVLSAGQALTSVDMALIRMIANLKSRDVVIFVNRIDELPDPAAQVPEIEQSIRQTLKDHDGPADAEIIFGSAYWAGAVLSGEIEEMDDKSAAALMDWARHRLEASLARQSAPNIVWEMSGLPTLWRALSERIVGTLGNACLANVARSAITIGTSRQAARSVVIEGAGGVSEISMHELRAAMDKVAGDSMAALEADLEAIFAEYRQRADRAHETFLDRATHSLLEHLERRGAEHMWEYDPTGLRLLLRSAYSVLCKRVKAAAERHYEAAVRDAAGVLYQGFGAAVEGIQLGVPEVPEAPAPVALAQTIALDFNDSWWASWWRRARGQKAFAKRFRRLILAETEDFMSQMKDAQTVDIRAGVLREMTAFFDQQKDVLFELTSGAHRGGGVEGLFASDEERQRRELLDSALETFERHAA
ncbi:Dynamin family protein [Roseovarius litoreus]|uniref:Dynamin family protein n=1 Tax=Roseovarius litoreus TaxID=1155722 RepID=A0A1M7E4N8_9RHOB|nr:dynamin family protein [Roseovarius litoreus]SHL86704.1 Dynamin family protein [Roseovarius litoreus]